MEDPAKPLRRLARDDVSRDRGRSNTVYLPDFPSDRRRNDRDAMGVSDRRSSCAHCRRGDH